MNENLPPADGVGKRRERGRPRSEARQRDEAVAACVDEIVPNEVGEILAGEFAAAWLTNTINRHWMDAEWASVKFCVQTFFAAAGAARGVYRADANANADAATRAILVAGMEKMGLPRPAIGDTINVPAWPTISPRRTGDTRTMLVPGGHRVGEWEKREFVAATTMLETLHAYFEPAFFPLRFAAVVATLRAWCAVAGAVQRGLVDGDDLDDKPDLLAYLWERASEINRAGLMFAAYLDARHTIGCRLDVPHLRLCRVPDCAAPLFVWWDDSEGKRGLPKPPDYCAHHSGASADTEINESRHRAERKRRERGGEAGGMTLAPRKRRKRNRGT